MDTPTSSVSSQEKLGAALGAFLFFIPLLLGTKTEFVVKYMKQGFFLNIVELSLSIISSFIWGIFGIAELIHFICFLTSLFLAFQAFSGKTFVIDFIYTSAEKLIKIFNISSLFTPGK